MPWLWAALMPHPPVLIQEIGKGREQDAAHTLAGTQRIVQKIRTVHAQKNAYPDALLVFSPHHPSAQGALLINAAPSISANLVRFGAPSVGYAASTAQAELALLVTHLTNNHIPFACVGFADLTQDHGTTVPLTALADAFPHKQLPPVIVCNPCGLTPEQGVRLGEALASFSTQSRLALLASGDLSHCLTPHAPAGFTPEGAVFDKAIVAALEQGSPATLLALSAAFVDKAGQCGLLPVLAMLGLCKTPVEILSYEGPFGVGYCNALWVADATPPAKPLATEPTTATPEAVNSPAAPPPGAIQDASFQQHASATDVIHPYARFARALIAAYLAAPAAFAESPSRAELGVDPYALANDPALWNTRNACFVSIKSHGGALRGCMGTILPTQENLAEEITANAIMAATRDPRFPSMQWEELDSVTISVDVLSLPEPIQSLAELDPARWGVIATKGNRRGLLLPDLPGVDSVEQQVGIAMQKGGIRNFEGVALQRFSVHRFPEHP